MGGLRDQVVHLRELRDRHVGHAADLVAASAGQVRIERRRHAVGIEIVRSPELVIGRGEVAIPVAVIARAHRHAVAQLVLDFRSEVPVRVTDAPSAQHVVRRVRRGAEPAEVRIRHRTAFAVGPAVLQIAVGHVVAVGVGPRARDAVHRRRHGVVGARDRGPRLGHVAADRHLQRGPAVAEQIVRGAEARVEVLPRRHAGHRAEVARGHPPGRGRRDVVRIDVAVEVVEPRAVVEREPTDRPLILEVEAHVGPGAIDRAVRRRVLRDRRRHAVAERIVHVALHVGDDVGHGLLDLRAELVRVRTGDVRDREALRTAIGRALGRVGRGGVVPEVVRQLEDRDVRRLDAGIEERRPVRDGQRAAGLEEQLRRDRRAPVGLIESGRTEMERNACFGRAAERADGPAEAVIRDVGEEVELVLLRRLPRDAHRFRFVPLRAVRRVREIGRVDRRALRLVPEIAGHQVLVAPLAERREEPELVLPDRPAKRHAGVVDLQDLADRREAARAQVVVQVRRLEAVARVQARQRS